MDFCPGPRYAMVTTYTRVPHHVAPRCMQWASLQLPVVYAVYYRYSIRFTVPLSHP